MKDTLEMPNQSVIHAHKQHNHEHTDCHCCTDEHTNCHSDEHGLHEHSAHKALNKEKNHNGKTIVYQLENLGCANCAAKMENKINNLPEVSSATITFATKQLKVVTDSKEDLQPTLQKICSSIESEVKVSAKDTKTHAHGHSDSEQNALPSILFGAGLFLIGEVAENFGYNQAAAPLFIIAYCILGWEIVWTAVKNIAKGQIFDENFLMSIATLGAFAIKEYPEAVGVMLFYRIGEYFEHAAVERSRSQIMEAVDMRPEVVNLVEGSETKVIPAGDAKPNDIVLVRPGDRIPLDGIIIEGESYIDTSPVTGEPVPVTAKLNDSVISGCVNTSGLLKIRVEKPLAESMVSKILDSVENAAASKPKIDHFITKFARVYTPFVVVLAAATAIIPSLITGDWNHWIYTALTFLVISCPCALVLSVPLAFFSGIGAGSKQGILFKGGISLEAMKDIKAVVMDKTGTVTEGNFVVSKIVPSNLKINLSSDQLLKLCGESELNSTHPIGISIVAAAREKQISLTSPISVEEIAGKGIKATLENGEFLCGNKKLMEAFHIDIPKETSIDSGTEVYTALNGEFAGYILISDTIKKEAHSAISALRSLGIKTAMLTGDAKENANAVARETGIEEVHAKLLPEEKLSKLKEIRKNHGSVMFVGDGINDAPVLAGADVGAAMGSGADAAIEAADVVFMTSSMEAIPSALSIARNTSRISMQNVIFALAIKALVMILGLAGIASMWMAVFADTGVAMLCVLNSIRILYAKKK